MNALPQLLHDDILIEQVTRLANFNVKKRFPLLGDNWIKIGDAGFTLEALAELLNKWLEVKKNGRTA